jgi:asparagine synthase (glutamine-hydrolysing)
MLNHDLQLTLADNDLRKVVRMTELAGVRVRFPMLDDDVMEFSARVPPALLMAGGRLRDFYKRAMAGFLPEATLGKSKHGFGMPFDLWTRTHPAYRDFILDGCRDFARRGILVRPLTERLLARDFSGARRIEGMAIDIALIENWLARRGL